jgi:hypothetical protein
MLTHIVVWKYRADIEQAIREEHVARLRRLPSLMPEIQSFSVGFDTLHLARSYDTGLVAVFRDRAALDAYTFIPNTSLRQTLDATSASTLRRLILKAKAKCSSFQVG